MYLIMSFLLIALDVMINNIDIARLDEQRKIYDMQLRYLFHHILSSSRSTKIQFNNLWQ